MQTYIKYLINRVAKRKRIQREFREHSYIVQTQCRYSVDETFTSRGICLSILANASNIK